MTGIPTQDGHRACPDQPAVPRPGTRRWHEAIDWPVVSEESVQSLLLAMAALLAIGYVIAHRFFGFSPFG